MSKTKKVLRTILVAGVLSALAALATFSAFSSSTDNPGNSIAAGTVVLGSNGTGSAAYTLTNAKPGATSTPYCITVNYTGSLDSDVRLYTPSTIGSLGSYANLLVETGSQATPNTNCSGFTPDASGSTLFNNTLNNLPTTAASGVVDSGPGSATKWVNGNSVTYRITASLPSGVSNAAQGLTTGTHTLRFEADNQ
jgi:predicted ribosomally synthesized peptide with SipW-like signal peptide